MKKKRRLLQSDTFWGLAAALLVLLQFWWLPGEDGSAADSYSTTVDGKLGLYRTLSQLFPDVTREAVKVLPAQSATLILVAPDRYPNEKEQQQIYEFVYNGGDLLFAPNWLSYEWTALNEPPPEVLLPSLGIHLKYRSNITLAAAIAAVATTAPGATPVTTTPDGATTAEDPSSSTTTDSQNTASSTPETDGSPPTNPTAGSTPVTTANTGVTATEDKKDRGVAVHATSSLVTEYVDFQSTAELQLPSNLTTETLLTSADGTVEAATWQLGSGRVLVCSSADLFSNRAMLFKGSRRLAVRFVERCSAKEEDEYSTNNNRPAIVISEYFNASDSFQNTGILFSPTLRIGTLQLLLVAILGIWMAFHRFGPALYVTNSQRRSLTESAQAVGNLQYRLSDGGTVVRSYLDYMTSRLRRRYGSLLRLDQPEQIANRAGMDVEEVRAQLHEAHLMAESGQLPSAKAAAMLRWLARLQQRLEGIRES
ncbi:MAG: hypothetical protein NT138_26100 [Planctomycetales bacterium]|nr:hypothetical protein [Planctomycetales bacterium]